MGNYTDKDEIIKTLGGGEAELVQLTDNAGAGVVDDADVNDAIARAEGAIDDALASAGYATPVALPSEQIKTVATDLAICRLYSHEILPVYKDRCDQAHAWLKHVATGQRPVPGAERLDHGGTGRVTAGKRSITFTDDYFARMPGGMDA